MTFLDAVRTGKQMRRAGWWLGDRAAKRYMADRWLVLSCDGIWTWRDGSSASPPTRADLLRDDWEVAP